MAVNSQDFPWFCDQQIKKCLRCPISYCHGCYSRCPRCNFIPGEIKMGEETKRKCDFLGCRNLGTRGLTISPGTFVTLCEECYNRELKTLEEDNRSIY